MNNKLKKIKIYNWKNEEKKKNINNNFNNYINNLEQILFEKINWNIISNLIWWKEILINYNKVKIKLWIFKWITLYKSLDEKEINWK